MGDGSFYISEGGHDGELKKTSGGKVVTMSTFTVEHPVSELPNT
jgi:hypothetical protein